jgi:hypothetical protein
MIRKHAPQLMAAANPRISVNQSEGGSLDGSQVFCSQDLEPGALRTILIQPRVESQS